MYGRHLDFSWTAIRSPGYYKEIWLLYVTSGLHYFWKSLEPPVIKIIFLQELSEPEVAADRHATMVFHRLIEPIKSDSGLEISSIASLLISFCVLRFYTATVRIDSL